MAFFERLPTLSSQAYAAATTTAGPGTCAQADLTAVQATGAPVNSGLTERLTESGSPERGRLALSQYACSACHTIAGVTSSYPNVGPPLTGMASRRLIAGRLANMPDNMVQWLRKPHIIKPDTAMPDMGVTEVHARDMASYLGTLH